MRQGHCSPIGPVDITRIDTVTPAHLPSVRKEVSYRDHRTSICKRRGGSNSRSMSDLKLLVVGLDGRSMSNERRVVVFDGKRCNHSVNKLREVGILLERWGIEAVPFRVWQLVL